MKANSFTAIKRAESRECMASLRRARKSRAATLAEPRANGFIDGCAARIMNLRPVSRARAAYAE